MINSPASRRLSQFFEIRETTTILCLVQLQTAKSADNHLSAVSIEPDKFLQIAETSSLFRIIDESKNQQQRNVDITINSYDVMSQRDSWVSPASVALIG